MMKNRLFKLLGLLILLGSLAGGWVLMEYRLFTENAMTVPEGGTAIMVEPGTPLSGVAAVLQRKGLIDHPRFFVWMARLRGKATAVQAGEYRIGPGLTPPQLLAKMAAGEVIQYELTLVEGWTIHQTLAAVREHPRLKHTLGKASPEEVMARIGHPDEHPEGRFFPDTYHFPSGTTDVAFLRRAYRAMEQTLAAAWEGRVEDLPYDGPYEALIMASIVEKETAVPDERGRIAGVFVRRLEKGMRLQTDPTVIYGLGQGFDGNIRRRDLRRDTPYNTYLHSGLPPTPIAMPGAESIEAALHPAPGDALYFVSKGDGSHHFSATLEEHNRAVRRYQLNGG
ncbi:MAG TPA: endolytic transglycosylase MltG [Gammaproteobacteria bacterium]|nr:endolytic transglycosylase MltG [Gammaproteobacteria bacterium]